jgi:alpha-1,3-rhamnosyltransferase
LELIVTDDASKDDTVKICREWIENNKNRFVRVDLKTVEKNTGIAKNCNRGLKMADGEWLKFIAGDDILMDDCIKDNLLFANENKDICFITSQIQTIDESGNFLNAEEFDYDALQKYYFSKPAQKQLKTYVRLPIFLNSPAFFIRKDAIIIAGGFDERFKIYEDICLIYRMNVNNYRIYNLEKNTVKYRIHDNAISRNTTDEIESRRKIEQLLIFDIYRRKHLIKLNPIDLSVYYETWLNYEYKGFFGHKAKKVLLKFSLFYWYLKILNLMPKGDK